MPHPPSPDSAIALWIARRAADGDTLYIAETEARLDRVARAASVFAPGVQVLTVPPWDVLPYDRAAPSAGLVGRRVQALCALAAGSDRPRLVLTSADAVLQLVPARSAWGDAALVFAEGDALDFESVRHLLAKRGYHLDERVDGPGEVAFRGHVIDIFPAGDASPVRIAIDRGRITGLHRYDAATQRSLEALPSVSVLPAVEFPLDPNHASLEEEAAPLPSGRLVPLFEYCRGFGLVMDAAAPAQWEAQRALVEDAYDGYRRLRAADPDPRGVLPKPGLLYLSLQQMRVACATAVPPSPEAAPEPAARRVAELVRRASAHEGPVIIATPGAPERLAKSLARRGLAVRAAASWEEAASGGVACLELDLEEGFEADGVLVLAAGHLVRARVASALNAGDGAPRLGDVVVHLEHGAAQLTGLKRAGEEERAALHFADGAELLIDPWELDRVWRYGGEGSLDRIAGAAWRAKRLVVEAEIAHMAQRLAEQAAARGADTAPVMGPDQSRQGRGAMDRLSRRFPYALSSDQAAASEAVLEDLRRGVPMNRLVCGDVGFGKTEVALRAAAAAALAGYQVAIVAPTTVLARQHLETVRRRFAGTDIRVEALMGTGPEGKAVRAGLADGSVGVVVGTQALAAEGLRWKRLGLVVVDEEQRFGEGQKQSLLGRRGPEGAVHALVMTATPIPRTMQMAMVGLRDVSVIATAPVRRQPTRTLVAPFDPVLVRDALLRERSRGGQSFVVCPHIVDLAPMAALLAQEAPRLRVVQAHGRMKAEALEAAVVGFAGGEGDVLLATNIIEAGLDISRANTMVVLHSDRFGLAQLHQIRGRVGRGGRRGVALLTTDPGRTLAAGTMARLKALERLSSLGAGVAISAADLDHRGAGELFGDVQAGHVSALGTELYQHLLLRAVRALQGEPPPPPPPVVHAELAGRIPEDYVPEPDLRLSLYRRLARLCEAGELDEFEAELHDRFGDWPEPVAALLAVARLRCWCSGLHVARLDSGPRGAALTPMNGGAAALAARLGGVEREGRVIVPVAGAPGERARALVAM